MSLYKRLALQINLENAKKFPYKGIVVDLGCGTSPYKEIILSKADKYIGVDWENSYHRNDNIDIVADITKRLPIRDNFCDTVTSFQVMEHLPEPDFFLKECFRILKTNGMIILTVPLNWHVHEAPYDYYRYTKYGLEYLLTKNGFKIIEIKEVTGFWTMWLLKFNYHTLRFARGPFKLLFRCIWYLNQTISPILDRYDKHPEETAGYYAIALKD